jgi:1,4-alpha-glucan branching enzyme
MAVTKEFNKKKPVCKVTFTLPAEAINGAKKVALVGDFNAWDVTTHPLKKQKDGSFMAKAELAVGQEYHYRFVLDGTRWENDWAADKYVASPIGEAENSVVVL